MECNLNLPELLAGDLEKSRSVFLSRCMTAGAPCLSLTSGDADRHYSLRGELNARRSASPHQQQHSIGRVRSADTFGNFYFNSGVEANSAAWLYQRGGQLGTGPEAAPDWEAEGHAFLHDGLDFSDDASHSSMDIEPPSIRQRQQSVMTAATSVTSGRCSSATSQKPLSPAEVNVNRCRGSWMDLEPESIYHSLTQPPKLSPQRPHTSSGSPSTPPEHSTTVAVPRRRSSLNHHTPTRGRSRHSRQSSAVTATTISRDMAHFTTADSTPRPENAKGTLTFDLMTHIPAPSPSIARKPVPSRDAAPFTPDDEPQIPDSTTQATLNTTATTAVELSPETPPPTPTHAAAIIHPSSPQLLAPATPPGDDDSPGLMQTWLDSSIDTASSSHPRPPAPMVPAAVPLPREIVESLRVHTSCFPETMLMPDSLAIETIRAYARKMKRPGPSLPSDSLHGGFPLGTDDPTSPFQPDPDPPGGRARRWKLPRMLVARHHHAASTCGSGSVGSRLKKLPLPSASSPAPSPSPSTASLASAQRQRLDGRHVRAVFPAGSEYLCDALYAHLVAYNYVSLLCPPAPAAGARRSSRSHSHAWAVPAGDEGGGSGGGVAGSIRSGVGARRIPAKAATVLGISAGDGAALPLPSPAANFPGCGGGAEAALREVHGGLADCIGKLVSTLKLTTGHLGGDVSLNCEAVRDVDPLFLRALCEMVRCAEELV